MDNHNVGNRAVNNRIYTSRHQIIVVVIVALQTKGEGGIRHGTDLTRMVQATVR